MIEVCRFCNSNTQLKMMSSRDRRDVCVVRCRQSLLQTDTEHCDTDEGLGGCTDNESLRCSAESLLCDELMWMSDEDSNCEDLCCPR